MTRSFLVLLLALFVTAGPNRGDLAYSSGSRDSSIRIPKLIEPRAALVPAMADDAPSLQLNTETFSADPMNPELKENSSSSLPTRSLWIFTLVGAAVLLARVYRLNHARDMADHERDFHHAKSRMFQMLQGRRDQTSNALRPTR